VKRTLAEDLEAFLDARDAAIDEIVQHLQALLGSAVSWLSILVEKISGKPRP
jgi:hypothetical protein